jgi:CMP-N,N'-diacetyllegionaminic acid synthase
MNRLIVIPARGGSKGIPKKNIRPLKGKPLIQYTIEIARKLSSDEDICVSTDSPEIAAVVESSGLSVPFIRPLELASDVAGSRGVVLHALDYYYSQRNKIYDSVVLLQPTSPFRTLSDLNAMIGMFHLKLDMVVSVKESHANPYFSLFEENALGFLELSKKSKFVRRQDCPKVFAYNGAVYIINVASIQQKEFHEFDRIQKFVMNEINSVDIDNQFDWWMAEMILEKSLWERP